MTPGPDGHRYFEELAVSHVVGGLDESEGSVFRAHLLECDDCRAQVGELRAIAHDLADVERDERRVRAAKAVDTKRRESEEDEEEEELPQSARASRLVIVVGLVLVVLLSAWNFTLRGGVERLIALNHEAVEAAAVLNEGTEWRTAGGQGQPARDQAHATVKELRGRIAVLAVNLAADRNRVYGLYVYNAQGDIIQRETLPALNRRFVMLLPHHASDVRRVLVTDPGPGRQPGDTPADPAILDARRPVSAPARTS